MPHFIRYSETLEASPAKLIDAVCQHGFEGTVAKRRASLYEPGKRSGAWQKMRVHQRRTLVIGGHTLAGRMAAHEWPRTTKLYDRTSDQVSVEEIERIEI